jgi:hypothetical protein
MMLRGTRRLELTVEIASPRASQKVADSAADSPVILLILHDRRARIPTRCHSQDYLLIWKSHSDGTVQEAARIASHYEIPELGGLD